MSSRASTAWGLATVAVVATALAIAAVGDAARGSLGLNGCSLITAARARSILGYPVRAQRGDTLGDCVLVSIPIRLDPVTSKLRHPTVGFTVYTDGSRPRTFSAIIALARKQVARTRKAGWRLVPVASLGPGAYIVVPPSGDPYFVGHYQVLAKIGTTILDLSVSPSVTPISQAQTVRLAKLIATGL